MRKPLIDVKPLPVKNQTRQLIEPFLLIYYASGLPVFNALISAFSLSLYVQIVKGVPNITISRLVEPTPRRDTRGLHKASRSTWRLSTGYQTWGTGRRNSRHVFHEFWLSSGFGRWSGFLIPKSQMLNNLFYDILVIYPAARGITLICDEHLGQVRGSFFPP